MYLLIHFLKISFKIVSSKFPYNRFHLFWAYAKLVWKSIVDHKFKLDRTASKENIHSEVMMGFSIRFFDYIQIITLFEEIFIHGIYKFSPESDQPLVVDCGSNIGLSILYFKTLCPSSRIIAFEPDGETFELLQANVSANRLLDVVCHKVALTNFVGSVSMYKGVIPGALGMTLNDSSKRFSEKVFANFLSDFIHEVVDFLKMDIEGSEVEVLDDLIQSQKIRLIKQMIIEFHPSITGDRIHYYIDMLGNDFAIIERSEAFPESPDRLFFFVNKSL